MDGTKAIVYASIHKAKSSDQIEKPVREFAEAVDRTRAMDLFTVGAMFQACDLSWLF